jgi:LAS superfamily LD-carboxypeptidase LdcB
MQTLSSVLENPVQAPEQEVRPLSLGMPQMNLTNSQTLLDTAAEYQKLRAQQDMFDQQNSFVNQLMGINSGTGGRPSASGGFNGVSTQTNNKHGLTPGYWTALSAANAAMKAAGLGTFTVTSGFRSDARQAQLYAKSGGSGYVAKPGRSNHRTGNAADLHLTTAQQNWLRRNGSKYGIQAPMWNPTGKRGIVERWHWEYTGR